MTVGNRIFLPSGLDVVEVGTVTLGCASCHDEVVARSVHGASSEPARPPARRQLSTAPGVEGSHPVDVPYPDGDRGYVPRSRLDPRIRLPGGNVTCLSCHPEEGTDEPLFANRQSRLCLSCHVK
jgi:predicted CXXCH cytochrome family protein